MSVVQKEFAWEQRLSDYRKAFAKLTIAINIFKPNDEENLEMEDVDDLLKEGLIKRFEYTHELAWKVMKDYAVFMGNSKANRAKDFIREGHKMGLISNVEEWLAMLATRNETSLLFNENAVEDIFEKILESYYLLLLKFEERMLELLK